mmetsp:Transcript_17295/g.15599  ORF Transcript_17295/g.15599 Transcript_17295/m.15599 type:complete len:238 (+) Transcript_17295:72-785(+)
MLSFLILLLVAVLFITTNSFNIQINKKYNNVNQFVVSRKSINQIQYNNLVLYEKKDLFSDDLFGEEDENDEQPKKTAKLPSESIKKKYLDEKWELSPEDNKEFPGFQKKPIKKDNIPKNIPVFALFYKFRKEYKEANIDLPLADHNGYSEKFKRILKSEVLALRKGKGVCTLWAGSDESEKEDLRAEINRYVESDPLVLKDMVESWDVLDLQLPKDYKKSSEGTIVPSKTLGKTPSS